MRVELDHLVVAALTLEEGVAFLEARLGVPVSPGGRHPGPGTHNALLRLGRDRYLEVIAVDPDAGPPTFPRWFGLDDPAVRARLAHGPRLVAWVARTDDLDLAVRTLDLPLVVRPASRGSLSWRFAFTPDGSLPLGGATPHLIQWDVGGHPAERLPDRGVDVLALELHAPEPDAVEVILARLGVGEAARVVAWPVSHPHLVARLTTPTGVVELD